jgi:uncharacterized membrane protein (DUF4010 family)
VSELFERVELRVAVALIIGLVIGAEREQRASESPSAHKSAGIRTFAIVSLLGAVGALLEQPWTLAVLGAGVVAASLVAYALGDRTDPGLTSEAALTLTFGLGALAIAQPTLALAIGITAALLLAFRARIHSVVKNVLTPAELRDALLVAGAAIVALPLLPDAAVDPWGVINPFVLWRLVVLILVVHLGAHVARRALGARWGMAVAGLASGFVSSTATIAAMGDEARRDPSRSAGALAAATASTVATFIQLFLLTTAASPALSHHLAVPLGAGAAVALAIAGAFAWRASTVDPEEKAPARAVDLRGAALFVALVTGVSVISTGAHALVGEGGVLVAAAIAGLADAHASSASVASLAAAGGIPEDLAVIGVLACTSTNAGAKMVVAFTSGGRPYGARMAAATAAVLAAAWVGWALAG